MSGVSTFVWGPLLWRILHTISFAPNVHPHDVIGFMDTLQSILPCVHCRESYVTFMAEPPFLADALQTSNLAFWMYTLHERVNTKLSRPTPPFESVQKRHAVRPVQWTPVDVWDLIALLGFNYTSEKGAAIRKFWKLLPILLRLGDGVDVSVAELIERTPCPTTTPTFIATALLLESAHAAVPLTAVTARTHQYRKAVSNGCHGGVCS